MDVNLTQQMPEIERIHNDSNEYGIGISDYSNPKNNNHLLPRRNSRNLSPILEASQGTYFSQSQQSQSQSQQSQLPSQIQSQIQSQNISEHKLDSFENDEYKMESEITNDGGYLNNNNNINNNRLIYEEQKEKYGNYSSNDEMSKKQKQKEKQKEKSGKKMFKTHESIQRVQTIFFPKLIPRKYDGSIDDSKRELIIDGGLNKFYVFRLVSICLDLCLSLVLLFFFCVLCFFLGICDISEISMKQWQFFFWYWKYGNSPNWPQ